MIQAVHACYILDASVAAMWFTRHGDREKALALRDLHRRRRCRLVVPEFALLEIINAVRFSRRAKEADTSAALAALRDLDLQIELVEWDLLRKATAISWGYQVALYDAVYVALAERQGFPLLTADEVLVKKMKGHSIVLRLKEMDFS